MILRPCANQPCPALVEKGRCPSCQRKLEAARGSSTQRGYGSDWERVRRAYLAEHPFCQIRLLCNGVMAIEVDHIIPIEQRPDLRLEWSNLQSACKPCNVAKA